MKGRGDWGGYKFELGMGSQSGDEEFLVVFGRPDDHGDSREVYYVSSQNSKQNTKAGSDGRTDKLKPKQLLRGNAELPGRSV